MLRVRLQTRSVEVGPCTGNRLVFDLFVRYSSGIKQKYIRNEYFALRFDKWTIKFYWYRSGGAMGATDEEKCETRNFTNMQFRLTGTADLLRQTGLVQTCPTHIRRFFEITTFLKRAMTEDCSNTRTHWYTKCLKQWVKRVDWFENMTENLADFVAANVDCSKNATTPIYLAVCGVFSFIIYMVVNECVLK